VLDDEVELGVVRRGPVYVPRVKGVLVQRPDGRALVDVEVLDPELLALLKEGLAHLIVQAPTARALIPLSCVELDALHVVLLGVLLELLEPRLALAGIEAAVDDQPARVLRCQLAVLLRRVEAVGVPLLEIRRLEDRVVDVALLEHVALEVLRGDIRYFS